MLPSPIHSLEDFLFWLLKIHILWAVVAVLPPPCHPGHLVYFFGHDFWMIKELIKNGYNYIMEVYWGVVLRNPFFKQNTALLYLYWSWGHVITSGRGHCIFCFWWRFKHLIKHLTLEGFACSVIKFPPPCWQQFQAVNLGYSARIH